MAGRRRITAELLAISFSLLIETGCGPRTDQPSEPAARPADEPLVRVMLRRGESRAELEISATAGARLADRGGTNLAVFDGAFAGVLSAGADALRWNDSALNRQRAELIPVAGGTLELDGRAYRGSLRFILTADGGVAVINVLPIETYLIGVLRGELPHRFHLDAQRALAVAARTYALYQCAVSPDEADFDLYAGERSQVYRGVAGEDARAIAAVRQTRGLVLTAPGDAGRIFEALYASTCGGATISASAFTGRATVAPLRGGVVCTGCQTAGSPFLEWSSDVRLSRKDVRDALFKRFPNMATLGLLQRIEVAQRGAADRPTMLRVVGDADADRTLRPEELRVAIGGRTLRSSWFEIETDEDEFIFTGGRGNGHGAGLCQYGAQGMARSGKSALQILAHYYPDSAVVRAY